MSFPFHKQVSFAKDFSVEPAIFSATRQNSDVLSFCFGYFPEFYKLPHVFQKSDMHHLAFVERDALCNETVLENITSKIVITDDGQCGNLGKIHTLQNLGAWGVLIVNNSTLKKPIASVNVTAENIHIFTGMISQSLKKAIFNFGTQAIVKLRAESYSIFTSVLLVIIAVSAVMLGSYLGGTKRYEAYKTITDIQDEMNKADSENESTNRNDNENVSRNVTEDENSDNENESKHEMELNSKKNKDIKSAIAVKRFEAAWKDRTTYVSKTFAVVMVLIACVLLLLLYFFYSYLDMYGFHFSKCVVGCLFDIAYFYMHILLANDNWEYSPSEIQVLMKYIFDNKSKSLAIRDCILALFANAHFSSFVLFKCSISAHTIIAVAIAVPLSIWWYITRHESYSWIYQDILGFCFIVTALRNIRMPNMKIITFILVLLFVYDIFFVFITPFFMPSRPVYFFQTGESVMVKVAMGDGNEMLPIALRIPMFDSFSISLCEQYSMLGFGDMLVPGLVLCYCYGFDLENEIKKFYFLLTSVFYTFGLIMAVIASKLMNSGQPALLYIVPSIVIPVIVASLCRNEFKDIWYGMPRPKLPFEEKQENSDVINASDSNRGPSLLDAQNQPNKNDM
ncbi:Signal peptide peptidase-like 2B [Nymphon striatum]|nr:Signal peptide peptidase-like 2B [Nymphon striatum]